MVSVTVALENTWFGVATIWITRVLPPGPPVVVVIVFETLFEVEIVVVLVRGAGGYWVEKTLPALVRMLIVAGAARVYADGLKAVRGIAMLHEAATPHPVMLLVEAPTLNASGREKFKLGATVRYWGAGGMIAF